MFRRKSFLSAHSMLLLLQRSPDPVPYRGAYFRIARSGDAPARASVVLPPTEACDDTPALALLLGLVVSLGDPPAGGAPIRQHWLSEELRLEGKMGSEISSRHAAEAERLAERIAGEWGRFLGAAFARLRGESRSDAHFRFAPEGFVADHPVTRIVAWPPLGGERLPPLE